MLDEQIIEVLHSWNFWEKDIETGIIRDSEKKASALLNIKSNKILTITGPRRCGKTYLARQIVKKTIKTPKDRKNTLIINFEEPAFYRNLNLEYLTKLYAAYKNIVAPTKRPTIVLDEIQEIPGWEKFARSLQEKNEAKIIITGSSAKLLSSELSTLLTGRTLKISLFPFSFKEILNYKKINYIDKFTIATKATELKNTAKQHLKFGGYPEIVIEKNDEIKKMILKNIYTDIIYKDAVKRYNIKNISKFESLARYYLANISSPITYNKISRFLNLPVKTVEIYSKYLETTNILFFIKRFSYSPKVQDNSPRKVYAIDNGLAQVSGFRFMENLGKFAENLVAVNLLMAGKEIYYWKDSSEKEVDFLIRQDNTIKQLIQVSYNIDDPKTKERELRALLKASEHTKCTNLLIITWDYENTETIGKKTIKYIPLWKWLIKS